MAWSRVKTIIIYILLLLNLFLLILIGGRQLQTARYEAGALRQTLEALSLNGITVDESVLPGEMTLPALTLAYDPAYESVFARQLLSGDDVIAGYSGALSVYSSVSGNLTFRGNGEFSATFSLPWAGYPSASHHASALLEALGIGVWQTSAAEGTVTAIPTTGDAPIFNASITLVYAGDVLCAMEGYLPGTPAANTIQPQPISLPTALVSVLEYVVENGAVCRSIDRMTPGYRLTSTLSDTASLTPCWLVETDTIRCYVDALTGTVTLAE